MAIVYNRFETADDEFDDDRPEPLPEPMRVPRGTEELPIPDEGFAQGGRRPSHVADEPE